MDDIKNRDAIITDVFDKIKENVEYLLDKEYSNSTLMQNAFSRGFNLVKGKIDKQTIVDLSVIAITFLVQKELENDRN